jgi:hypothetical protein
VDKFSWIKDLVAADRRRESGVVDGDVDDLAMQFEDASVDFLQDLKLEFLKVSSAFNQLNGSTVGPVRVYTIAKTKTDFMLFRNSAKLVFSLQNGGGIIVSHQMGITGEEKLSQHILTPEVINFGQLRWMYKGHPVEKDYLIRFYMSQFVKASAEIKGANPMSGETP